MRHRGSVSRRVGRGTRTRDFGGCYRKRLWGGQWGVCLGDAVQNGPVGSWPRSGTGGVFPQRINVTQENRQYHVGARVTKFDQGGKGDILLPSYGA